MPMEIVCSTCSTKVKVKDELIGKSIKCPKCGKVFKATADAAETKAAVTASAGAKAAPKKPPALWDDPEDKDEADDKAPWAEKKKPAKDSGKKAPAKKKAADDDDDDDDERDEDAEFAQLLEQTTLPDATKKLIKSDLGLREKGVWVGQPDGKIMTVRAVPKVLAAFFVLLVLTIILGVGGGLALEIRNALIYIALAASYMIAVLFISVLILFMDRRKALHTAYVITNKRCITYVGNWFFAPTVESFSPEMVAKMRRMGSWFFSGAGDIVFRSVTTITTTHHARGGTSTSVSTTYYGFLGIRNLDEVEQRIRDALLRDDDDDDDEDDEDERPKKKKKKKRRDDDED